MNYFGRLLGSPFPLKINLIFRLIVEPLSQLDITVNKYIFISCPKLIGNVAGAVKRMPLSTPEVAAFHCWLYGSLWDVSANRMLSDKPLHTRWSEM